MKIIIMGRTGSGKSALVNELVKKGKVLYKSYTTRPKRNEWDNGYHFVDKLPDDAVLAANVNGFEYGCSKSELMGDGWDVIVLEPTGFYELADLLEDDICLVYVQSGRETRKMRSTRRDSKDASDVFDKRDASEDKVFSEFEKNTAEGIERRFPNVKRIVKIDNNGEIENLARYAEMLI